MRYYFGVMPSFAPRGGTRAQAARSPITLDETPGKCKDSNMKSTETIIRYTNAQRWAAEKRSMYAPEAVTRVVMVKVVDGKVVRPAEGFGGLR